MQHVPFSELLEASFQANVLPSGVARDYVFTCMSSASHITPRTLPVVSPVLPRSNKPAVGHNCLFDVSYGLYGFADAFLPATWRDFKKMARSWHPGGLWDTKHLARQLPEVGGRAGAGGTLQLHVAMRFQSQCELGFAPSPNTVRVDGPCGRWSPGLVVHSGR